VRGSAWIGSIAVHGALIAIAMFNVETAPDLHAAAPTLELIDVAVEAPATPVAPGASGGGGQIGGQQHVARRAARPNKSPEPTSPWGELTIGEDTGIGNGDGTGIGNGLGNGTGNGIGFGNGGGVEKIRGLPAVPAPFISKARPAKLIYPSRQVEVDEVETVLARVTVDENGDVVGAHMVRTLPGSLGETASSMIWVFRYSPALDDDGKPVRSTFVQPFLVR
jgi:Gram-negative bacterial TonB protein C-terminal